MPVNLQHLLHVKIAALIQLFCIFDGTLAWVKRIEIFDNDTFDLS